MTTKPLFITLPSLAPVSTESITIWFNDQPFSVPSGRSIAAALLAVGIQRFRSSSVSGVARAPYCMMGACFECLVEVDGVPSRQSCLIEARDGMRIRSQEGAHELNPIASKGEVAR
ncbi:(2Fe-2S)-binding protein [Robbsia andropogonis]|uniref:(2Fe-2S)-binding protein n=1 Tax=Robbsia andropogonis TaxID=28092 RepID=UPI002A6B056C|nr:(2Fe-2S)-binding protein [Robbsia andropogonis]